MANQRGIRYKESMIYFVIRRKITHFPRNTAYPISHESGLNGASFRPPYLSTIIVSNKDTDIPAIMHETCIMGKIYEPKGYVILISLYRHVFIQIRVQIY